MPIPGMCVLCPVFMLLALFEKSMIRIANVKRNNNTIIKGTYPLDISKLQKDKDGKYKIKVRAEDSTGRYRVEVIKLKPYYNK